MNKRRTTPSPKKASAERDAAAKLMAQAAAAQLAAAPMLANMDRYRRKAEKAKRKLNRQQSTAPIAPPSSPIITPTSTPPSTPPRSRSPSPVQPPPKKRRFVASSTGTACPHCCQPTTITSGFCPWQDCKLRVDQEFGSDQNEYILKQRGQSTLTPAPAPRTDLSPREKDLQRQYDAGEPFERFDTVRPCSVAEADALMLGAFGSAEYEPSPSILKKLIQSGKLINVGDAVPRRVGVRTDAPNDTTSTLSFNADGSATRLVTTTVGAPLKDFTAYVQALFGIIIPSLIMQPTAIVDWCTLSMTLIEIQKVYSWSVAEQYLEKVLKRAVGLRQPFGQQFPMILQDIILINSARSAPVAQPRPQQQQQQQAPKDRSQTRTCSDFNFRLCTRPKCNYTHTCHFGALGSCPTPAKIHAGKDCTAYATATQNGVPYKDVPGYMIGGDPNYKKTPEGRGRSTPLSIKKK